MAGAFGRSRSNDLVPNGPIIPLADITLPGTLNLATYATYGSFQPSILNAVCTGTFNISTVTGGIQAKGVAHAASTEIYLPVNGQALIYINGSGTFSATLYTTIDNENANPN